MKNLLKEFSNKCLNFAEVVKSEIIRNLDFDFETDMKLQIAAKMTNELGEFGDHDVNYKQDIIHELYGVFHFNMEMAHSFEYASKMDGLLDRSETLELFKKFNELGVQKCKEIIDTINELFDYLPLIDETVKVLNKEVTILDNETQKLAIRLMN